MKKVLVLIAALVLLLGTSGCGKGEASAPPEERLAAAAKLLDETEGLKIKLQTDKLPERVNGLLEATGTGTKAPAFEGNIKAVLNGLPAGVPVIAVDNKVYINLGGWKAINPADFGAPDPAKLFGTSGGLSGLFSQVSDAKTGEQTRRGEHVYSTITGTIPGSAVKALVPQAAEEDFDAKFLLDDDNVVWQVELTGPFYPKVEDVTYKIGLSDYGTTATIKAP